MNGKFDPSLIQAFDVALGERFEFGKNHARFLKVLTEERITAAEYSLLVMLGMRSLSGMSFLDIGSGSGLFSLAARRLGARVHSFDFDPDSVACTKELRRRHHRGDPDWTVDHASVLDRQYMNKLALFDIVYCWGVLHHTGSLWTALRLASTKVTPGGQLFISVYDDQGGRSQRWRKVKKFYCASSRPVRALVVGAAFLYGWGLTILIDALKGEPLRTWRVYSKGLLRGMSPWTDLIDWVGGYPFEVARPGLVIDFLLRRGFRLDRLVTQAGGNNEFVFSRAGCRVPP